jgi:hypothetical protein
LFSGLTNTNEVSYGKKLADFRAMSLKKPSIMEFKYSFNRPSIDAADDASDTAKKSPMKSIADKNADQPTIGTRIRINVHTNPFTNLATKRPKDSTRMKVINEDGREFIMIKDPQGFDSNDVLDYYNLCAEKDWLKKMEEAKRNDRQQSESFSKPPLSRNSSFYSTGYGSVSRKSSKSLLEDEYGDHPKDKEEEKEPIEYKSAIWFGIDIRKDMDHAYTILLQETVRSFFEAIPLTYRKDMYTTVFTEICCLEPSAEELGKKRKRTSAMENLIAAVLGKQEEESMWAIGKRIILVVLLHEDDHFLRLEQKLLEADLFFSRFLQSFSFQIDLQQSLAEIFAHSMKYFQFEEKLFGPQEEELGEEGSNPLRFAKEIRTQKKLYKDILENLQTLSREELQQHCRKYGRTDQGTNAQLIERVKEIIGERLELVGFGELSNYGRELILQIYERIKSRPKFAANTAEAVSSSVINHYDESGLKLWEFNQFLYQSNSKTLYDKEAYQDLVQENKMLLDRNQHAKVEALSGYYERFGKLNEDILSWGIANLDSFAAGNIAGSVVFDTEALFSITHLFSKLSTSPSVILNIPRCYQLLGKITSVKEAKIEGDLQKLSDLVALFPWKTLGLDNMRQDLMLCLAKPGGVVEFLMNVMAKWCDGEDGVLPVLRQYVTSWRSENAKSDITSQKDDLLCPPNAVDNTELPKEGEEKPNEEDLGEARMKKDWIVFDDVFKNEYLQEVYAKIEIAMKEEEENKKLKEAERLAAEEKAFEEAEAQRIRAEQGLDPMPNQNPETFLSKQAIEEIKEKEKEERDAAMKREYDIKHNTIREVARAFLKFDFRNVPSNGTATTPEVPAGDHPDLENASALTNNSRDVDDPPTKPPPKIISIKSNEDWKTMRESIVEELLFLHSIRQMNNCVVSLDESIAIETLKKHHFEVLQHLHVLEYDHYERLSCQFLAMYDALRLFSTGLSIIGMGTRDFCCRSQLDYNLNKDINKNNLMNWLPVGLGEMIYVKELLQEKKLRFERRRIGALAALERERLRRQMTEEDHELLRLRKLEALRLEYEKEERLLFDHALSLLINSRESRKNSQELNVLAKTFEQICLLKEKRFPDDFGVNVARNNLACVLLEIYGLEHPLAERKYPLHLSCRSLILILS